MKIETKSIGKSLGNANIYALYSFDNRRGSLVTSLAHHQYLFAAEVWGFAYQINPLNQSKFFQVKVESWYINNAQGLLSVHGLQQHAQGIFRRGH